MFINLIVDEIQCWQFHSHTMSVSCLKPEKYGMNENTLMLKRLLNAEPLRIFKGNTKNKQGFLGIDDMSFQKNKWSPVLKTNTRDNNNESSLSHIP